MGMNEVGASETPVTHRREAFPNRKTPEISARHKLDLMPAFPQATYQVQDLPLPAAHRFPGVEMQNAHRRYRPGFMERALANLRKL